MSAAAEAGVAGAADATDAPADAQARFELGERLAAGGEHAEAARHFRAAADEGLAAAQHGLGVCLARGRGVARDLAGAEEALRRAAAQGHPGSRKQHLEVVREIAREKLKS